jgi:hypothetical protein
MLLHGSKHRLRCAIGSARLASAASAAAVALASAALLAQPVLRATEADRATLVSLAFSPPVMTHSEEVTQNVRVGTETRTESGQRNFTPAQIAEFKRRLDLPPGIELLSIESRGNAFVVKVRDRDGRVRSKEFGGIIGVIEDLFNIPGLRIREFRIVGNQGSFAYERPVEQPTYDARAIGRAESRFQLRARAGALTADPRQGIRIGLESRQQVKLTGDRLLSESESFQRLKSETYRLKLESELEHLCRNLERVPYTERELAQLERERQTRITRQIPVRVFGQQVGTMDVTIDVRRVRTVPGVPG